MWIPRSIVVGLVVMAVIAGLVGATADGFAAAAAPDGQPLALTIGGTLVGVGWALSGALLAWLRPANTVGWVLLGVGVVAQLSLSEEAVAAAGWLGAAAAAGDWTARPTGLALTLVAGWSIMTMLGALPAIYPDGFLRSSRWRWPVILVALGAVLVQAHWVADQPSLSGDAGAGTEAMGVIAMLVLLAGAGAIWVLATLALVRSPPPRRQQLSWLLASVVIILIVNMLGDDLWVQIAQILSLYLLPVAFAVALLRYRLLGIDAAARTDPMRAFAEIGTHVTNAEDGEILQAILASVRRSVSSPGAQVIDSSGVTLATSGALAAPGFTAALTVAGAPVGVLDVAPRWPGGAFAHREERMLSTFATQLAAVIQTQRLSEQLEAQRDAAMAARTKERERLRRELHDGLGPALTGIGLGLTGLEDAVRTSQGARAVEIAEVLRREAAAAVAEVRRILEDLHPAVLEQHGLAEAIRRQVSAVAPTLPVTVSVGPLPDLPAHVQQAAYRVVAEAVANAARHAHATRLDVAVAVDERELLVVHVVDDGQGFDIGQAPVRGIGLASMRQRAHELGGHLSVDTSCAGTTVRLDLPIAVPVG